MKTVLLVEDDELNRKFITKFIELNHYRAVAVPCAEDALETIESIEPDLVLMDIMLPGMDGLSATRTLKENPKFKNLPVVALSALAMEEDKRKAFDSGCAAYIVKPIDLSGFSATLKQLLE